MITGATSRACAGETINIETLNAKKIDEVVLVRCGSFTHAFNPDQRLVSVPFEQSKKSGNLLIAFLPNNSAVLIPGYYLLFILAKDHVPSEGRFVHICRSKGRSMRGIDPDWWRRVLVLFEKLRVDPGKLERLELDVEGEHAIGQARKLAEAARSSPGEGLILSERRQPAPFPAPAPRSFCSSPNDHGTESTQGGTQERARSMPNGRASFPPT